MKKFAMIGALAGICSATLAAHAQTATEPNVQYIYGVFHIDQGIVTPLEDKVLSRGNSKHRLCWSVASSTPVFNQTIAITEQFTSPVGASFSNASGAATKSAGGTQHTLQSNLRSIANSAAQNCWKFDSTDPIGKYSIAVTVENVQLPAFEFEVSY